MKINENINIINYINKMIRLAVIVIGLIMILKKIFKVIKNRIESYRDTSTKHFFNVQVAKSDKEREIGLMGVKKMQLDSGMLFEYPDDSYPSMWMKNTLIPLDMLFIDNTSRISSIHENAVPLSEAIIQSKTIVVGVLELNGGAAQRYGITPGNQLIFPAG